MANLRKYAFRRVSIAGGQAEPVEIRNSGINVLRFINWGTYELRASVASDPETAPMAIVSGNGATNNLMDPAGISRVWVYAEGAVEFGLVEMSVDDPMTILAMESVVANMMTALPAGTSHVGQVGIDVGSTPVSAAAPLPVQPGTGVTWQVKAAGGLSPVKVTAGAAGDVQVKGTAGRVYAIATVGQAVIVKDGATERWRVAAGAESSPARPIECGTSIILTFPAAGDAYVLYE